MVGKTLVTPPSAVRWGNAGDSVLDIASRLRCTLKIGCEGNETSLAVSAPSTVGQYRVFVYALDGKVRAGTANLPFASSTEARAPSVGSRVRRAVAHVRIHFDPIVERLDGQGLRVERTFEIRSVRGIDADDEALRQREHPGDVGRERVHDRAVDRDD